MNTLASQLSRAVLPIALLVLASGCATKASVRVSRDREADFSEFTTWRWLEVVREEEGPRSDTEQRLREAVQQQIRRELSERGFRYRAKNADLGIGARLAIEREKRFVNQTTAIETLPTFDNSPPYEIQATQTETRSCERGRLTIRAIDLRRNREAWRGEYKGRCHAAFAPHVNEAVSQTLESFPAAPSEGVNSVALNPRSATAR